jgi:hypothetical protein
MSPKVMRRMKVPGGAVEVRAERAMPENAIQAVLLRCVGQADRRASIIMKDPNKKRGLQCDDGGESATRRQNRKGADPESLDHRQMRVRRNPTGHVLPAR